MKTPISEQKRPPLRRIGIASPAGDTSNARYARASLRRLSNSEKGITSQALRACEKIPLPLCARVKCYDVKVFVTV